MRTFALVLALTVGAAASASAASISGRVTDSVSGAALAGVCVEASDGGDGTQYPPTLTQTSASGDYAFQGLAAGTYVLRFRAYLPDGLAYPASSTQCGPSTLNYFASPSDTWVPVGDEDVTVADQGLERAGSIAGRVVDASGAPLQNVCLAAEESERGLSFDARTGADGRYSFAQLRFGTYRVIASTTGNNCPGNYQQQASAAPVHEGEAVSLPDFVLRPVGDGDGDEHENDPPSKLTRSALQLSHVVRTKKKLSLRAELKLTDSSGAPKPCTAAGEKVRLTILAIGDVNDPYKPRAVLNKACRASLSTRLRGRWAKRALKLTVRFPGAEGIPATKATLSLPARKS